ncbi:MAG: hypothetical protein EB084_02545 [Proteobacteria bacterium]|nr:hypothetical protein [Pseudomonadota bacterium]
MRRLLALLFLLASTATAWSRPTSPPNSVNGLANFAFIERQRAVVKLGDRGNQVIWRVDADALTLRAAWHDVGPPPASQRGTSDLVSTDDIAWVALAYLEQAERGGSGADRARSEARSALRTLIALQRADGGFVAYQSPEAPGEAAAVFGAADWMAGARAVQAFGAGMRVLARDESLSNALQVALESFLQRLSSMWSRPERGVGRHLIIDQKRMPAWLPFHRADAAAAIVLGLCDWQRSRPSDATVVALRTLADGLVEMQRGSVGQYPWEAFLPQADRPWLWYADGNLQASALAHAREVLQKPTYQSTALLEADVLYPRILSSFPSIWQITPIPETAPAVPGTAASLAMNCRAVWQLSGKDRHAALGALFASWLLIPGKSGHALYDPGSGRCAEVMTTEGPSHEGSVGASARAICALLAISATPVADLIRAVPVGQSDSVQVLPAVDGRPVTESYGVQDLTFYGISRRLARLVGDNAFWLRFETHQSSPYAVDLVFLKERTTGASLNLRLDGDAILSLPLESTPDEATLARVRAIPTSRLDPGLHTLGVKGNGLALSGGSLLDVFLVYPTTAWRAWRLPGGRAVAVAANLDEAAQSTDLPVALQLTPRNRFADFAMPKDEARQKEEHGEVTRREDGTWMLRLPPYGCGLLEW